MHEVCNNILRNEMLKRESEAPVNKWGKKIVQPSFKVPTTTICRNVILDTCGVDIQMLLKDNTGITKEYRKSLSQIRSYNTSQCMKMNFGVDFIWEIGLPRKFKGPDLNPSKEPHSVYTLSVSSVTRSYD